MRVRGSNGRVCRRRRSCRSHRPVCGQRSGSSAQRRAPDLCVIGLSSIGCGLRLQSLQHCSGCSQLRSAGSGCCGLLLVWLQCSRGAGDRRGHERGSERVWCREQCCTAVVWQVAGLRRVTNTCRGPTPSAPSAPAAAAAAMSCSRGRRWPRCGRTASPLQSQSSSTGDRGIEDAARFAANSGWNRICPGSAELSAGIRAPAIASQRRSSHTRLSRGWHLGSRLGLRGVGVQQWHLFSGTSGAAGRRANWCSCSKHAQAAASDGCCCCLRRSTAAAPTRTAGCTATGASDRAGCTRGASARARARALPRSLASLAALTARLLCLYDGGARWRHASR